MQKVTKIQRAGRQEHVHIAGKLGDDVSHYFSFVHTATYRNPATWAYWRAFLFSSYRFPLLLDDLAIFTAPEPFSSQYPHTQQAMPCATWFEVLQS